MAQIFNMTAEYVRNNPKVLLTQGACVGVAVYALPVALPLLGAAGFGAAGPFAGSAAAAFQSANGATVAFSVLQSAAMGGYGAATIAGAVQGGAAVVAAGAQVFAAKSSTNTTGEATEEAKDGEAGAEEDVTDEETSVQNHGNEEEGQTERSV